MTVQAGQLARETLLSSGKIRSAQLVRETLLSSGKIRVAQVVRETLRSQGFAAGCAALLSETNSGLAIEGEAINAWIDDFVTAAVAAEPEMPIQFVGSLASGTAANDGQVVNFSDLRNEDDVVPTLREGDLVVVAYHIQTSGGAAGGTLPTAYIDASGQIGSGTAHVLQISYRFMDANPEKSVYLPNPGGTTWKTWTVFVLRGVDPLQPLDVAVATALGSGNIDPPAATPASAGSVIMATGAHNLYSFPTNPAGFSTEPNHFRSHSYDATQDNGIGTALKFDWVSGAVDPGVMSATSAAWRAATLVFRKKATSVPGTPGTPTASNIASTSVDLTFTDAAGAAKYEYRLNGGAAQALASNRRVTGLSSATLYNIEVRGVNSFGVGAWSAPVAVTTTTGHIYRYIFVEFQATGNNYIGCSTLKVLDSGGIDHALQANGGVASANYPVHGSYPVTNVNDGNDASFTTSSGAQAAVGNGITIDLGANESIVKLGYRSRSDSFGAAEAITSGKIYGRLDPADPWTELFTITESGWASNEYREWILPG